jgi:3-oxoacyl-[acyl-carrier protein] reductase
MYSGRMSTSRRVALVAEAGFYVGPALARILAQRGHDLVLGNASAELVAELEALGAAVEVVPGVRDLADPATAQHLVDVGIARFGAIHAAAAFSGQIITGRFLDSTAEQLGRLYEGCMVAPFHFLQASATAARPSKGAALYSAMRAGATMMAKNVAEEVAAANVQVNAVGTNFMDFPGFLKASGATDPAVRAKIEAQVPQRRLGTMDEFAAFCAVFLDGTSRFTTGQWVGYAGGWV